MTRLFLLLLVLLHQVALCHDARETFCRDHNGNIVDWWVLYKQAGTGQYIYLSSKDAALGKTLTAGLSPTRLVTDSTSPFTRTVVESRPLADTELDQMSDDEDSLDNRILMAWNDQQPKGKETPTNTKNANKKAPTNTKNVNKKAPTNIKNANKKSQTQAATKRSDKMSQIDPNLKEIKLGNGMDMYGWGETEDFAHSKGIMGMRVVQQSDTKGEVRFYLLSHSFPRTPNGTWTSASELLIKRRFITPDNLYGSNITKPNSKAQHAMCISMTQSVKIKDGVIVFNREKMNLGRDNLFAILNGLDVIGPSMTLTNFVPWYPRFKAYHQLFDIRSSWSEKELNPRTKLTNLNVARVVGRDESSKSLDNINVSPHAFPLWPHGHRVKVVDGKFKSVSPVGALSSLRNPKQINTTRCQVWKGGLGKRKDEGCFTSARITSTNFQSQIVMDVDFKNALFRADTDDIIAARLVPREDIKVASDPLLQIPKKYVALTVVTQSWFDHATLGSHSRDLFNNDRYRVKAWFHNNLAVYLPKEGDKGETELQRSNGLDHSKWFVTYLYGQVGNYIPLAGVMDLNRNGKATRLVSRKRGRSGMFLFSTHSSFVSFFMSLSPVIEDNSNFTNTPIDLFTKSHIKASPEVATVEGFSDTGDGIQIKFSTNPVSQFFHTPYSVVPNIVKIFTLAQKLAQDSCKAQDQKRVFLLGSPGRKEAPHTPRALHVQPRAREGEALPRNQLSGLFPKKPPPTAKKRLFVDLTDNQQDQVVPNNIIAAV